MTAFRINDDQLVRPRARATASASVGTGITHFGLKLRASKKYSFRIERETYAQISKHNSVWMPREFDPAGWDSRAKDFDDEDHRVRSDSWCEMHQARALENYDLNMKYFASLDHDAFGATIAETVSAQPGMVEVTDLNDWKGVAGLYVMVLDDYCQAYAGQTSGRDGIMGRIKKHWGASKEFDKLIWGSVQSSIISVDSFRALDTTRIFAAPVANPLELEDELVQKLPSMFTLNRVDGGDLRQRIRDAEDPRSIIREHEH